MKRVNKIKVFILLMAILAVLNILLLFLEQKDESVAISRWFTFVLPIIYIYYKLFFKVKETDKKVKKGDKQAIFSLTVLGFIFIIGILYVMVQGITNLFLSPFAMIIFPILASYLVIFKPPFLKDEEEKPEKDENKFS